MTDTTKPKYLYGWTDQNASPITLYTDSAVLTLGMPLYDNTGIDTGLTVDIINQDGTFDVNSGPLYYCYRFYDGTNIGFLYSPTIITNTGDQVLYYNTNSASQQASSSSQLTDNTYSITIIYSDGFRTVFGSWYFDYYRYPSGDLYT